MLRVAVFLSLALLAAAKGLYTNHQLIVIEEVKTLEHVAIIEDIVNTYGNQGEGKGVLLLNDAVLRGHECALIVEPAHVLEIFDVFTFTGIEYKVLDQDVQKSFDESFARNDKARMDYFRALPRGHKGPTPLDHTFYRSTSEINDFLQDRANSHSFASRVSIGNSFQGQTMYALEINNAGSGAPAVYIDSGIHAREWISYSTSLWMIDEILTGTSADAVYLRDNFNWYFVPNVNPDGYDYTRTNRMWRKTRSTTNPGCPGTDGNRNFDFNWRRHGTSTNPCSDTYGGASVFSEIETRNIRDYVLGKSDIELFISMHSFSQLWLVNWAGDLVKPADYDELMDMARDAVAAIAAETGRVFLPGTAPDLLYAASGGTYDWAKDGAGIKWSYTPELRPASMGDGGFDIPASNIIPSGQETFAAVVASCRHMDAYNKKH